MKKILFSIFRGGVFLLVGFIIYLSVLGGFEWGILFEKIGITDKSSVAKDVTPVKKEKKALRPPSTMEEYLLSFEEMLVVFKLKDGDVIGQLYPYAEGSPEKKLTCFYGGGNYMCDIKKVHYDADITTIVIAFTKCVNGDNDGCAEKKITDYRCKIDNKLVKGQYPGKLLDIKEVVCEK